MTLSDKPVSRPPREVGSGIPDRWAAAEGLAGVTDNGCMFDTCTIAPRWLAMGDTSATVVLRYGASDGYVAYHWRLDRGAQKVTVDCASSGARRLLHVMLPAGTQAVSAEVNGRAVPFVNVAVEQTPYVDLADESAGGSRVEIGLR